MPGVALARSPWKVCAQRMNRYAVAIEYDGSAYSGWQTQQSLPTIQGLVESALSGVAAERIEVVCAGRTDAGVHARWQIAHFDTNVTRPMRGWVMGANTELPRDISLTWARPVPLHFHARYSAEARTYRYLILNRPVRSALAEKRAAVIYKPHRSRAYGRGRRASVRSLRLQRLPVLGMPVEVAHPAGGAPDRGAVGRVGDHRSHRQRLSAPHDAQHRGPAD